jgi:hypothetical protein
MNPNEEPLAIARALGAALDAVGARWAVGGSVASSVHGVPRSTADLDVVVAMSPRDAARFAQAAPEFLVDEETLRDQLRAGRSYNVFHAASMTKIDLFPATSAFERNQLARAARFDGVPVTSAEDTLVAKLRWFRLGGEVSDRQWRDILGLIEVQRLRLDQAHLQHWATELGVADLLAKALADGTGGF